MVPFLVLPQTTPACSSSQPLCFHRLAASCLSFSALRPLFSLAYSLFGQKQGGGYTLENPSFKISDIQTLFPRAVCHSVIPGPPEPCCARPDLCSRRFCSPFAFITIRIASPATPLFSHPYKWGSALSSPCPPVAAEAISSWHLVRVYGVKASVRKPRP